MPLAFPLSIAAFLDLLPVQEIAFNLERRQAQAGLGSGEILQMEVAPPRWRGYVSLAPMREARALEVSALLARLEAPGASFMAYRRPRLGPASDPNGAALVGALPKISSRDQTGGAFGLSGLPAGFVISPGDLVQVQRASGSGLYQFLEGGTATGAGVLAPLSLVPHIRPDAAPNGSDVLLVRAACRAVLVPGGVNYGATRNRITSGLGFEFREVFAQ